MSGWIPTHAGQAEISSRMEEAGLRALDKWLDEDQAVLYPNLAVRDVFLAMTRYRRRELAGQQQSGGDRSLVAE